MRTYRWITSFFVLAALLTLPAAVSAAEKASRPATKEDLVGTWDMVSVKPVHDKNDPVFYPHQRFVFNSNSSMKYMVSERPFNADWLKKFAQQMPEIDFSVNEKGLLTLTWQTKAHHEDIVSAYVLKDVPAEMLAKIPAAQRAQLPKKGNITLSFLNKSGKIAYQKILAKVA